MLEMHQIKKCIVCVFSINCEIIYRQDSRLVLFVLWLWSLCVVLSRSAVGSASSDLPLFLRLLYESNYLSLLSLVPLPCISELPVFLISCSLYCLFYLSVILCISMSVLTIVWSIKSNVLFNFNHLADAFIQIDFIWPPCCSFSFFLLF